jgi:YesN/AraC family two-component response regulator
VRSRAGRSGAKAIKTTRVLLADDHTLVRAGIRSLLEKMTGIEVVAEAGDGREALELIKKQLPNVVLMDIAIPRLNGLEALARATKDFSSVKVIILSMHANEEYVLRALRAQLLERLDIHDVAGLVRYAMRAGLVPPEGQPGV